MVRPRRRARVRPVRRPLRSPAPPRAAVICAFTPREHAALAEMQQHLRLPTIADALNLGVWHLARHLDLDLPIDLFAIGCPRESYL
jgi:hypothetical protein